MRFTLLAALCCQSASVRQKFARVSVSQQVASLGDRLSTISHPSDSLVALKEATGIVEGILADSPNDLFSDDDAQIFRSVVDLVENSIYSSMDSSHEAAVAELAAAVSVAATCNRDIAGRQAPDGDLGILHQHVQDEQSELDRLQGVVDEKTEANNTRWAEFDIHMRMIADAPACPEFPARTYPTFEAYFEETDYSNWFAAQQAQYDEVRDAFAAAESALEEAIDAYNIQKAVRDTQHDDWKAAIEPACAAFDTCFLGASDYYTKELVPRVTADMNSRIEVKEAGDTLLHQTKFLLGEVDDKQTPDIDTSRYELTFPELPAKGLCEMEWVPKPKMAMLVDGCSRGKKALSGWGPERWEVGDLRAGEAVCCTAEGAAVRHFQADGQPVLNPANMHSQCSTPNGGRLYEGDSPSHTFFEAKAICDKAGLRMCSTQAEVDTSCGNGCMFNQIMVWIERMPLPDNDKEATLPPPGSGKKARLMDGCSRSTTWLSGWGAEREEFADARAGEAVCCTAEGTAVRHILADGQPSLTPSDPHRQCTTPNGKRLYEGDSPSHTFFEAKAICDKAGLRMCSTQAELDTGCGTGCWFNTIMVWVE